MRAAANGQKKNGHKRPKVASEDQAELELLELVGEDEEQERDQGKQTELVAKFAAERLALELAHKDRVLALESQHHADLARLDARQAVALVLLWKKQGRKPGPWALRIIEGVRNGTPG
jgi:hypothetical protein